MDDLREVLADELPVARHFVVNLQRQVQRQLGQFDRLSVIRGSQVVVHVAQNIFETIFEIDVVGFLASHLSKSFSTVGESRTALVFFRSSSEQPAKTNTPNTAVISNIIFFFIVYPVLSLASDYLGLGVRPAATTSIGSCIAQRGSRACSSSVTLPSVL